MSKVNQKETTSTARSTQAPQTSEVSGSEVINIYKPTIVKEDPLPLDSTELSYAESLLKASNNGLIPVRLEEDVVIQRISHDLYSDPKSGFRELYNNEARACRIARKHHGENPRIEVRIAPSSKKLVIHGFDSTGMSQQKFLTVYTVLGRSDNFDSTEVGQFGLGRACVSEDTECLTVDGWKKFHELKGGDLVAAYNTEKQVVEYQPLKRIHAYQHEGPIYDIAGKILTTEEHRHVVSTLHTHRQGGIGKRGWFGCHSTLRRKNGRTVSDNNPRRRIREEVIVATKELTWGDRLRIAARHDYIPNTGVGSDELAALIGWVIAEGWYFESRGKGIVNKKVTQIGISQNEGSYADEIRQLLIALNADWREQRKRNTSGTINIQFFIHGAIAEKIRNVCPDKKLNKFLTELPKSELHALFEALLKGDGTSHKPSIGKDGYRRKGGHWSFIQYDKQTIDWFQIVALRLGYHCKVSKTRNEGYTAHLKSRTHLNLHHGHGEGLSVAVKEYDGIVWCPEVENGTWICRRNGYSMITGNSYTCLSDIMVLETYCRETEEKYAVMGKNGIGYNVLPQPADLEQYGTRITVTLRSDINIHSLVEYVFEVCRFSGVETVINLEEDVKGSYDRELVKAGQYRTGLESMKEHVCKSRKGDSYHQHTPLVQVEVDDSDFYLYGEITARKYSWQSAADELGREERVGVYLLGTPIEASISLPLSFWILNVKDERRYPPTADRERLTEAAEKAVREKVMAALKERLSFILKLESPEDYVASERRMVYLQHERLDGLSDCMDERTKKVVEFVNTRVKVWERYNGRRSRNAVRIGSLLRKHSGSNLFCVANLTAAAAEALEQNVPGALVFEGYITELMQEFGVKDGDRYAKEHGLKRYAPPPTDEVTVYWRGWDQTQTGKINTGDIDDKVIKVPAELRDEYVRLMEGLHPKYRIAVDAKSGRNKKLLEGKGLTLADFVASVGKKVVATSKGPMTVDETLECLSADSAPVLFKYDDTALAEHLKGERGIAVVVPDDDSMYELLVFYNSKGIHASKGGSLYDYYGKHSTLAGVDMYDLKCGEEDRHAILHAYHVLRPVDQNLFELLACAIVGHQSVRTDTSVREMRDHVFSLAGLDGTARQAVAPRTGTKRSGRK